MVRTRVGYAGGTTPSPTYHAIGDHSETIEIDYDPRKINYEELLDHFWREHDPRRRSGSLQYRSAIFYRTEDERAAAVSSRERAEQVLGQVHTDIEPLDRFTLAEGYHQKYRLRNSTELMAEFREMYPDDAGFIASTAAARVNALLDGCTPPQNLDELVSSLGLSEAGQRQLKDRVVRPPGLLRFLR